MGQEYSKQFEAEPREVAGKGTVFGHSNGLTWLSPSQSMALKQPQKVPDTHIKQARLLEYDGLSKSSSIIHPTATALAQSVGQQQQEGELEAGIPILDIAQLEEGGKSAEEFKRQIARVCEEWGFFQVVNHGIEQSLVEDYMGVMKDFFSLPMDEKEKFVGSNFNCPALYGTRAKDWSDFLRLKCQPTADPDTSQWPDNPAHFRETAAEYSKQVTALGRRLMAVMAENLGLKSDYFNEAFQANAFTFINNNFYPVCPEPGLTLGLTGHSDPGGITILYQDEVGGLQVQKSGGPWVDVTPMCNAFVVNLADQIQIMSNGKYTSGLHRVTVNSKQPRFSVAATFSPAGTAKIAPAEELLDDGLQAPIYPEISFADYMVGYINGGPYGHRFLDSLLLTSTPPSTA